MFKEHGLDAVILNSTIDNHFISFLEMNENGVKFNRIDSDLSETLKSAEDKNETLEVFNQDLEKLFKENLGNDKLKIEIQGLKTVDIPAIMLLSEHSRRMQEMNNMFGGMDMRSMFPEEQTLVLNRNNALIKSVLELNKDEQRKEDVKLVCEHIYDLAVMSHKQLDAEAMSKFINRSNTILNRIVK